LPVQFQIMGIPRSTDVALPVAIQMVNGGPEALILRP